ncbi:cobalamin biosynthesis protein CbiB [Shewanella aestuarii]|nr:cobalamin biosynthesis protein CbiB [Shewanella aestuarii]
MQINMESLLLQNELIQQCLVLLAAIAMAQVAPLPKRWQPFNGFRLLATELASKVNHSNRPVSQQMTAGILATLLLVIPITVIASFLLEFAAFPWFFDFIVLYCCISDYQFTHQAKRIQIALEQNNNQQAKALLAPWVSQSTPRLSSVGLCKTTIEKTLTSPIYGSISSIVFFAVGGASTVIAVHLLKQLELSWPPYQKKYINFASFISQFNRVLFFLPQWIWHCSLAIQFGQLGLKSMWVNDTQSQGLNNDYRTLHLGANLLKIELGGPQQFLTPTTAQTLAYQQDLAAQVNVEKVTLAKVIAGPLPQYQHIQVAIKASQNGKFFFLSLALLLPLLWATLQTV